MTKETFRVVSHSQPVIFLATAMAHISSDYRWSVGAAVFFALQAAVLLLALEKANRRDRARSSVRFLSRAWAVPVPATCQARAATARRPHLRLV